MQADPIDRAEQTGRRRAVIMALGAIVLLGIGLIPVSSRIRGPETGTWIVMMLLWSSLLATGGAFGVPRATRARINDELSIANRSRGLAAGFFAMILAGGGVLIANPWLALDTLSAVRFVTAAGLSIALLRYAMLEWR